MASAEAGRAKASPPSVKKIHAVPQKYAGGVASWLLTATASDRDRDLLGGRVTIKVGAKGKPISRKIVVGRALAASTPPKAAAGITTATLRGKTLRIGFFAKAPPGPLKVMFWVADAHRHSTKQVALFLKVGVKSSQTVSIAATDPSASEPSSDGTFTVTRTGSTSSALTVSYSVSGTATAGTDYTKLPGTVTIDKGDTSATIDVSPIDDTTVESTETVTVTLTAKSEYAIGSPKQSTVTIADDDGVTSGTTVTVVATDPSAAEPSEPGTFTISRTGSTAASLEVLYSMSGSATNGVDYTRLPGTATIPAGSASVTVTLQPIPDSLTELTETAILTLVGGTNYAVGTPRIATILIASSPVTAASVTPSDPDAAEPSNTGTFTVSRTGSTAGALTVSYTVGGTATAGVDYVALPGSVTIPAGAATANITVTPKDDTVVETDETVVVTIVAGTGYVVGFPSSAGVTIADDETGPKVSVTANDPNATEAGDKGQFTVTRTGATTSSLTVSYKLDGSTATAGSDYTALPGTVTIAAGQSTATIDVTPMQDTTVEPDETVLLTLTSGTGYTVGTPDDATVTIVDDDGGAAPAVTIAATDPNAAEPSDTGTFTVTRAGPTTSALTVNYTVGGTATAPDYTMRASPVTIPAGQASATIVVTPVEDTVVEGDETVDVTLAAGTGYSVGTPSSATVTIADNDSAQLPTVTITAAAGHAEEPNTSSSFTVTRTGSTAAALTVFYSVGGTATNGADYTTLPGSVIIPAGQASATITVSVIDDAAQEGTETVVLTLIGQPTYDTGTPGTATVSILDND